MEKASREIQMFNDRVNDPNTANTKQDKYIMIQIRKANAEIQWKILKGLK